MDDAIKKVKQLAASALARKERLAEEVLALEAEKRHREAERELAISSDDDATALQLTQLVQDLDARLELKRGEVDAADDAYREIVADLRSVQDAAKEHDRLAARAPIDAALPDPFAPSAEDAALENVRRHIDELGARADLEDELGAQRKTDRELEQKVAKLDAQEAEAKAKAQLAELKAKKKAKAADAPAAPAAEPTDDDEPPPPKKKKTM